MRTNEERLAAMHQRAAAINKQKRYRSSLMFRAAGVAACLAVVILLAVFLPGVTEEVTSQSVSGGMSASMFTNSGVLRTIVIAVIAFLLGICVTILCFRLKKWQDEKNQEDS